MYIPRIYKSEILLTEVEPSEIDNIKLIISEISQSDIDTQYNPFIDMGTPDFSPTVMLRIFFQYVSHKAVFLDAINSLDTNINNWNLSNGQMLMLKNLKSNVS